MVMSFAEAAAWFTDKAAEVADAMPEMALEGAIIVQREAKAELGHLQSGVGPYSAWPELAASTQVRRTQLGYEPNDPLLMSGALRDSIQIVTRGDSALVGSNVPYAKDHENGTGMIPPRPFLGRAAFVTQDEVLNLQSEILATILEI